MSDADAGPEDGPEDPGDADVPDYAGELEHEHEHEHDGTTTAGSAGPADSRTVVVLAVIVVLIGALVLWAVVARGPASRQVVATTTAAPEAADSGAAALYVRNCAACHGPGGLGMPADGVPALAGSGIGAQIAAARILEGAPGGMPAYRGVLTDDEIATLATYVASLASRP